MGLFHFLKGLLDPQPFNDILGLAYSGRINEPKPDTANVYLIFYGVSSGTGNVTYDGALFVQ